MGDFLSYITKLPKEFILTKSDPTNQKFYLELQQETPRAAVILGAAFLDMRLRELISNFMINDKTKVDDLLGTDTKYNAPLSSFASRANIAYCLGLISIDDLHDLKLIAKIRNKFAHGLHGLTLNNVIIANWCRQLKAPKLGESPVFEPLQIAKPELLFLLGVSILEQKLRIFALQIKKKQLKTKSPTAVEY
jgi:hypothetical protein